MNDEVQLQDQEHKASATRRLQELARKLHNGVDPKAQELAAAVDRVESQSARGRMGKGMKVRLAKLKLGTMDVGPGRPRSTSRCGRTFTTPGRVAQHERSCKHCAPRAPATGPAQVARRARRRQASPHKTVRAPKSVAKRGGRFEDLVGLVEELRQLRERERALVAQIQDLPRSVTL